MEYESTETGGISNYKLHERATILNIFISFAFLFHRPQLPMLATNLLNGNTLFTYLRNLRMESTRGIRPGQSRQQFLCF